MILIWLRLPTDPKDPPNPFTCWQVDPTKHMTDMTDFSCWYHRYHATSCHIMAYHGISWHIMAYHGISWHIMAYHGFRLQHSCSNPPGGGRDDGRIAAWAGGREIPGDSGRSFFRSWLQLVVDSVIFGFVLLYWLTSVGVNIFKWNICETHTFICSIIYYI